MLTRSEIERREGEMLASYAARSAGSAGRRHSEEEHPYRSVYQRDKDRIIHCTSFRRLEYKTQVFVNHEGDYFRTRLTHTLEVAQISRVAARALLLNEDLTEAIALAHDLGHTPFGHSGEEALHRLMDGHGGFEHNRHGLRVVEELEHQYSAFPGLNLSWEVREGMVKHATRYDTPVVEEFRPQDRPLLEAQVVDLADAIAYDSHDVDDGLKAGLLEEGDLATVELWRRCVEKGAVAAETADQRRARSVRNLINLEVSDLVTATEERIRERGIRTTEDVRKASDPGICHSPEMARIKDELQDFLFRKLYRHYRVVRMSEKAKRFVMELFREYLEHTDQLPPEYQEQLASQSKHRVICDYIAGMTDRYAQDEYLRLFTPYERV
ncbi:MAG: deoxyguanosinetriphosphate triphosphohydrolase [Planctomycetota bacterium]